MSALLDKARAFALIAEHLPEERRAEVAGAIAREIDPTRLTPGRSLKAEVDQIVHDLSPHTTIANFLVDKGFTRRALVDATVKMTHWVGAGAPEAARDGVPFRTRLERLYQEHESELIDLAAA